MKNTEFISETASLSVQADNDKRKRIGEQAFQVEHYLRYWKTYPTAANWQRVIDAANAYGPEVGGPVVEDSGIRSCTVESARTELDIAAELRKGRRLYFTFRRSGPGEHRRVGLGRFDRVGARGHLYESVFRKGKRSWTVPR